MHRQLQLALENEVQQRTEELAASNEELRVTYEEMADSNKLLVRSNEELAQFAYVASHDLQEPLRKIRMFAGMLSKDTTLPPGLSPLVMKIDKSTERMVLLIRDLLEFSSLLKSDAMARPVNLAEVAANVVNDFELLIEDKKATVIIGKLPEIQAVALQMNQLLYNLLGNALKFCKPGVPPVIEINAKLSSREQTGLYISKPYPFAQYYHITIQDNGIGFETKYAEHIFEVFKRLHGREHYPGSGIGLAMCRRIADNHNGRLYAESEPGKGSIFHLLLPDKQHDYTSDLPPGFQWINQ
jgi:light-regulated signal transduction histidine kinase (bacteriophytochrome)